MKWRRKNVGLCHDDIFAKKGGEWSENEHEMREQESADCRLLHSVAIDWLIGGLASLCLSTFNKARRAHLIWRTHRSVSGRYPIVHWWIALYCIVWIWHASLKECNLHPGTTFSFHGKICFAKNSPGVWKIPFPFFWLLFLSVFSRFCFHLTRNSRRKGTQTLNYSSSSISSSGSVSNMRQITRQVNAVIFNECAFFHGTRNGTILWTKRFWSLMVDSLTCQKSFAFLYFSLTANRRIIYFWLLY